MSSYIKLARIYNNMKGTIWDFEKNYSFSLLNWTDRTDSWSSSPGQENCPASLEKHLPLQNVESPWLSSNCLPSFLSCKSRVWMSFQQFLEEGTTSQKEPLCGPWYFDPDRPILNSPKNKDTRSSLKKLLSFHYQKTDQMATRSLNFEAGNGNWRQRDNHEKKLLIGPEHTFYWQQRHTSCSFAGKYCWKAVGNLVWLFEDGLWREFLMSLYEVLEIIPPKRGLKQE